MSTSITNDFETRRYRLVEVAKEGDVATRTPIYSTDSTSGVVWVLRRHPCARSGRLFPH